MRFEDVADATGLAAEIGPLLHELEDLVVRDLPVVFLGGVLDEFLLEAELGALVDNVNALLVESK